LKLNRVLIAVLVSSGALLAAPDDPDNGAVETANLVERYVMASEASKPYMRDVQMEVDINASLPKLKKQGKLHAFRHISRLGQITYNALRFDGDNTVKKEVIVRYLTQETQPDAASAKPITPDNYKFKYKGKLERDGRSVHIFQVTPRKKAVGLFKGEVWVDDETMLAVRESGRFVKNPSVFVKKFEFIREYVIHEGLAIPRRSAGFVETRLWGRAELNVDFTNFSRTEAEQASLRSENE
jgi:hypothetical protein